MKKRGFTMIELIAVMAMSAVIGIVIMSLIISQNKLFFHINNETASQDETRLAFSVLEDDIRGGNNKIGPILTKENNVSINGISYPLPVANGESKGKVIYGFTKKEQLLESDGSKKYDASGNPVIGNVAYSYIYYKKDIEQTGYLILAKENPQRNKLIQYSVLSKDVEKAEITKQVTGEYSIDLAINKGSAKENFKTVVAPRN